MRQRPVQFANFVCHFGQHEMLDLVDEVVIPAFADSRLSRRYASTKHFLHDVNIVNIAEAGFPFELAIVGKYIKDTLLSRDQIFHDGALLASPQKIESAPSAIFVLTLRDHKLLMMPEVSGAPSMDAFRTTIAKFLGIKHAEFVKQLVALRLKGQPNASRDDSVAMRQEVLAEYPPPSIELIPFASEDGLDEFVDRFALLKSFSVKYVRPNNEINNEGFIKALRSKTADLNADWSTIAYKNAAGLAKETVKSEAAVALDGNSTITLSGTTDDGTKIQGSNEDFKVIVYLKEVPTGIVQAAKKMFLLFREQIKTGKVRVAERQTNGDSDRRLLALHQTFVQALDNDRTVG